MTVEEFVEEYKKAQNKENFIGKHIVNKYIPYLEKIAHCNNVIKKSMYSNINEKDIFIQNTPMKQLLFSITLVLLYTDIETDKSKYVELFDVLNENNIFEIILSKIPKDEILAWNSIMNMCMSDELENNRSIISFVNNKYDAIKLLVDSFRNN